jgi:hypothetical protein
MIHSPRAKPVIDIVRIENGGIVEIDEVYMYRRKNKDEPFEKVLYWKRGIHTAGGFGGQQEVTDYYDWGDEIGDWGTELKNGEWGKLIPKK